MNSPAVKNAVWFPSWPEALRQLRLPALRQQQYRLALIRYLRFCKQTRQPATVESARAFMETIHAQRMLSPSMLATWKEALNWFFKEAEKQDVVVAAVPAAVRRTTRAPGTGATTTTTDVPPTASADMGKPAWDRRLTEVLRTRHYQWRTELAYRQWAIDRVIGFRLSAVG